MARPRTASVFPLPPAERVSQMAFIPVTIATAPRTAAAGKHTRPVSGTGMTARQIATMVRSPATKLVIAFRLVNVVVRSNSGSMLNEQVPKGLVTFRDCWSGREDLNLRPLAPHASALAGLRHAPTTVIHPRNLGDASALMILVDWGTVKPTDGCGGSRAQPRPPVKDRRP